MPTMTWKEDALFLNAVTKGELLNSNKTLAMTTFSLDLSVAENFGLIEQPKECRGMCWAPISNLPALL